jgi:hypothetical protein
LELGFAPIHLLALASSTLGELKMGKIGEIMFKSLVLVSTILVGCAFCEEEDAFVKAARDYLAKHDTKEQEKKFEKKWKERCETILQDRGKTEEEFIDDYIKDWFFDKRAVFESESATIEDKLTVCRFFLIYKNVTPDGKARRPNGKQYKIPDAIDEHLTIKNLNKFLEKEKAEKGEKRLP